MANRRFSYAVPFGVYDYGTDAIPVLFLNRKDAYLPESLHHHIGKLGLFGGEANRGEGAPDAIIREMREETGDWLNTVRIRGSKLLDGLKSFEHEMDGYYRFEPVNWAPDMKLSDGNEIWIYFIHVDAGPASFKLLQQKCQEGIPEALSLDATMLDRFVFPEVREFLEQAFTALGNELMKKPSDSKKSDWTSLNQGD